MKFSKVYYTRYHLWQNLVSALGESMPSPEVAGKLVQAGYDFIMGDGTDVYEEEEKDKDQMTIQVDEDGTWSSGAYL